MRSKPGKGGYCLTDVPLGFFGVFLCCFFMLERDPRAPYLPGYVAFFFLQKKKKPNPYVATTKRIVYAFLSECQEKKEPENKDKTLLEFATLIFWQSVTQKHKNAKNSIYAFPSKLCGKLSVH